MEEKSHTAALPANPVSSYRIQFSRSFTLKDLEKNTDYIDLLGIASLYASPVFAAVPGSNHGYDVIHPGVINPEIGNFEDFVRVNLSLKDKKIGWIQDIVPNHMAYHQDNPWIRDVLEKGTDSAYFAFFDIEGPVAEGRQKLMLPFLGTHPDQIIRNGELQVHFAHGNIVLKYYDNTWPVNFNTFRSIFRPFSGSVPSGFSNLWEEYDLDRHDIYPEFLNREWENFKRDLDALFSSHEETRAFIDGIISSINGDHGRLLEIVSGQHYELCHWKESSSRINYRRFFTINGLICLRIEDQRAFENHHNFIKELLGGGYLTGLRIDHIDGLREPGKYLRNLRDLAGEKEYIIVEKILEHGENIPADWPVEGTSGYDFLALVNNLQSSEKDYPRLLKLYRNTAAKETDPGEIIYKNKKLILETNMQGELDNIFIRLEGLMDYASKKGIVQYNEKKGITPETLRKALGEFMPALPVYRFYPEEFPLNGMQRKKFEDTLKAAARRNPQLKGALALLKDLFFHHDQKDDGYNGLLEDFCLRLMQFTGPLTAKGVEDTSMYQYNCFVSHNEVGDSIAARGISDEKFHQAMIRRLAESPLSMNSTSTHDTKRGEDVRARLNAIADMAGEWEKLVKKWIDINAAFRTGMEAPDANEEYMIYQVIAGTFPMDEKIDGEYKARLHEYMVKALREAKVNSSWDDPNEYHEKAANKFISSILDPDHPFLNAFLPFQKKLIWRGIVNSLSQLAIKCLAPGTPDIYRGTEMWDLSLVDPDNRRPVDFDGLHEALSDSVEKWKAAPEDTAKRLYNSPFDGRIKQLVTHLLLNERRNNPDLFHYGDYLPLEFSGKYKKNVFGFIRKHKESWLMCILPLHAGGLSNLANNEFLTSVRWKDTMAVIPPGAPNEWENILTGSKNGSRSSIYIEKLWKDLPIAVFRGNTEKTGRKAGILMHISSLPGKFGTGDLGEEAYRFVDFLSTNRQSFWQTLPLTQVVSRQSWSPYASPSAFAGNTILISPRQLYIDGLVKYSELEQTGFRDSNKVNYEKASRYRNSILEKAYDRFRKETGSDLYSRYEEFCEEHRYWLDDYAMFLAFRQKFGRKEWSRWPDEVKHREEKTLKTARYQFAQNIMLEKFRQFIFDRQWKRLKTYANNKGIMIFGDIPYYVNFDSADLWANQELFKLHGSGKMKVVAGVPPDYFSETGQLWNMPVYDWNRLKETGYDWWLKRLERNIELFDLVRLDHFRAFSTFWEVPAGDKVAVNGKWRTGPGSDFFRAVRDRFPAMPFVAEDLGDIDQPVYDLRDEFLLPGMQVLQFSFDDNMAKNLHTPHNHKSHSLVYTGTHDNNTLHGWYEQELGREGKKRLQEYTGKKIGKKDLHWEMIRMAHASPAQTCIIPMQDYLGLGKSSRMNTPSTSGGNWIWKMKDLPDDKSITGKITRYTVMFNRI